MSENICGFSYLTNRKKSLKFENSSFILKKKLSSLEIKIFKWKLKTKANLKKSQFSHTNPANSIGNAIGV